MADSPSTIENIPDINDVRVVIEMLRNARDAGATHLFVALSRDGGDRRIVINEGKIGELSQKCYDTLTGIQNGAVEDPFNWVTPIKTHTYA